MPTRAQLTQRRALVAAAQKRHPPRAVAVPRAQLPRPTAYTAALTTIATDLNDAIAAALSDELGVRVDAADGDAVPPFNRGDLLKRLSRIAERVVQRRGSLIDRAIDAVAANVGNVTKEQWTRQAKAVVGIDLAAIEPNLTPTIATFRRANVDLITSMARDKVERVKAILDDAPNARVETIRDRIMEEQGVTKRQAALIARDQVLSLNAQVTQKRHAAAGVEKYIWRTSGDGDVRPAHRALNGKTFSYDDPPVVSKDGRREHPGEDYQCLPGDAPVRSVRPIVRAYRRQYIGEMIEVVTAGGAIVRATPNHPVLTGAGWTPIGVVDHGAVLFRVPQGVALVRSPSAASLFDAIASSGRVYRESGEASQFHGDGRVAHPLDVAECPPGLCDDPSAPTSDALAAAVESAGTPDSLITAGIVVDVRRVLFDGYVYNFETACGWFESGAVVHNCRCTAEPVIEGFDEAAPPAV